MKVNLVITSSFILLFYFFFTPNLYSQNNFKEGYIVTLEKDTLRGAINYRAWAKNPKKVEFKNQQGKSISYLPIEIEEFKVMGEVYKSGVVTKEKSPFTIQDLETEKELIFQKDTVFLRALFEGEKSLYIFNENFGKTQFYVGKKDSFELLVHKRYLKKEGYSLDKKDVIKEYRGYVAQLSKYLDDCANIHTQLPEIEYTNESLVKLFQFYYKSVNKKIEFEINNERTKYRYGVLGGVSFTSLNFTKDDDVFLFGSLDYLVSPDYPSFAFITGGGYIDIMLRKRLKNFSYYNELLFTQYKGKVEHESFSTKNNVDFGFSQLKLLSMARFNYTLGDNVLYLNAGVSIGYLIGIKNKRIKENLLTSTTQISELDAIDRPRKIERGLAVGIGYRLNKISIDIQFENGRGVSPYALVSSPTKRLYLIIGYQF